MKILEIASAFPPSRGGLETCVWELSSRLATRGYEVTVVTSTRGKEPQYHEERMGKVRIIRFPEKHHLFEAPIIPQMAARALALDYDILHVHGMSPTITELSVLAARLKRKPVVVTYHNDAQSNIGGRPGKLAEVLHSKVCVAILHFADVLVCSTLSYGITSRTLKHFRKRLNVIPMGVEASKYADVRPKDPCDNGQKLLFVGQLKDYKGLDVLLDSLSKLRADGHSITLDIAGTGPSLDRLRFRAKQLSLDQAVSFLGDVDDTCLPDLYARCDLVVLPSLNRREAFGIVQLEAMAAGKRVVASDIPGVRDIALLGGGILARPNDSESLTKTILSALSTSPDVESARKMALSMGWDGIVDKYEGIFQSLASKCA